jgi:hypothetical protein
MSCSAIERRSELFPEPVLPRIAMCVVRRVAPSVILRCVTASYPAIQSHLIASGLFNSVANRGWIRVLPDV